MMPMTIVSRAVPSRMRMGRAVRADNGTSGSDGGRGSVATVTNLRVARLGPRPDVTESPPNNKLLKGGLKVVDLRLNRISVAQQFFGTATSIAREGYAARPVVVMVSPLDLSRMQVTNTPTTRSFGSFPQFQQFQWLAERPAKGISAGRPRLHREAWVQQDHVKEPFAP
jgi:hypothetical protein